MFKYKCTCGINFKKYDEAKIHEESSPRFYFNASQINPRVIKNDFPHVILKITFKEQFINWLRVIRIMKTFKIFGLYLILGALINHFEIKFSIFEIAMISLGLGLIID